MSAIINFLYQEFAIAEWEISPINIILAAVLLVVGIFLGQILKKILKGLTEKAELEKTVKHSFIELFLTLIKWSIFVLFINLALNQLQLPQLTNWLTNILVVIPALVGALILIVAGFVIATYLKDTVEESKVLNYQILSNIMFYFILFVFLIFALKTALISLDTIIVNILTVILTGALSIFLVLWLIKRKK